MSTSVAESATDGGDESGNAIVGRLFRGGSTVFGDDFASGGLALGSLIWPDD